jgi:hypothetical protein
METDSSKADVQHPAAATSSGTAPAPAPAPRTPPLPFKPHQAPPARKPIDINSKEYKQTASKYVRFVVALPVLLVTSYFLWQRRECSRLVFPLGCC